MGARGFGDLTSILVEEEESEEEKQEREARNVGAALGVLAGIAAGIAVGSAQKQSADIEENSDEDEAREMEITM